MVDAKPTEGASVHAPSPGSWQHNFVLEPLKALTRDPNEKCIAVTEPGGDKGIDGLFCILEGEKGTELGNISQRMSSIPHYITQIPASLPLGSKWLICDLCYLVWCSGTVSFLRLWLD